MDISPSTQLVHDIEHSLSHALHRRRPLLHHLNADTSWLLQLPRPQHSIPHSGRHWYNILIDPWLTGSQSDGAAWFSTQTHASPPAFPSIAAVEALALETERLSTASTPQTPLNRKRGPPNVPTPASDRDADAPSLIDAIAISHEFTDHCHEQTLLQCSPHIPVLATRRAAAVIRAFRHFHTILETPPFGADTLDWRAISIPPLPAWLSIGRLVSGSDVLYYHSALLIAFECSEGAAEAVVYTPHGIEPVSLRCIGEAGPRLETLAFLHGLHDLAISGKRLNLGAHNGLEAQRVLRARYWVGTHDEVKKGAGVVSWILRRRVISLEEALREEAVRRGGDEGEAGFGGEGAKALGDVRFRELGNGESAVLV